MTVYVTGAPTRKVDDLVLEHIEADLELIKRIPAGVRCLCTVPDFPYESHVRRSRDESEVRARYGPLFDEFDILTLRGAGKGEFQYCLFEGLRNHRADNSTSDGSIYDVTQRLAGNRMIC